MKSLWPDSFEENSKESAKNLLEEQAKLLSEITKGVVYAEVAEMHPREAALGNLDQDFKYTFYIRAKFLEEYSFKVLSFCHNITFYPVRMDFDSILAKELKLETEFFSVTEIDTPEYLEEIVGKVLSSDRIKEVVGSIIKLSK